MARIKGVKEKLHMPIYDAFYVTGAAPRATFIAAMNAEGDARMIRFFVNIQNKTRLETNLQASGVLPSQNTFEARALRVVASILPAPPADVDALEDAARITTIFLQRLIYRSVTRLLVGEKIMIEVPSFYFPSGAGVNSNGNAPNHGNPDPMGTFRFAEPVVLEPNQNFRVEMEFPRDVPDGVRDVAGPLWVWVVLDGYLTRDAQ